MTEAEKKYFVARCNKDLVVREDTLLEIDTDEEAEFLVEALEKQIPKKVVNVDDLSDYAECPSCGGIATDEIGCLYRWCRECGQKLDWGKAND